MAKKKKKPVPKNKKPGTRRQAEHKAKPKSKGSSSKKSSSASSDNWKWIGLLASLLCTLFVYLGVNNYEFSNWDDQLYVFENPNIDLSKSGIGDVIVTPVAANIHPVTMLTLSLDHAIAGLDPGQYHLSSLIFHLANTALVFWFVFLLSGKRWMVATFCAFLFGVHPMHAESVAWISGRKDVVYTFFFMGGLIAYLKYLEKGKSMKMIGLSFLLFFLAAFSKPAAVVFPVILLLIDIYRKRKIDGRNLFEKAPFFAVAIVAGIITALIQDESGAVGELEKYSVFQRFGFAGYGFIQYIRKFFVPNDLSAFYPYPAPADATSAWLIYPLLALGIVAFVIWKRKELPWLFFGIMFYLVSVALVLQFVTVGSAIMADRYSYVPYIGLAFALAMGIEQLSAKGKGVYNSVWALGALFALLMLWFGKERVPVWENSYELWTDAMSKYPTASPAFKNRGKWFYEEKQDYQNALNDFDVLVKLKPADHEGHLSRGNALYSLDRFEEAAREYSKSVEIQQDYFDAWYGLGRSQTEAGNFEEAEKTLRTALSLKADDPNVYYSLGVLFRKNRKLRKALENYDKAIELRPNYSEAIGNRANVLFDMGRYEDAVKDYSLALSLNPESTTSLQNRSSTYLVLAQNDRAYFDLVIDDCNRLLSRNPSDPVAFKNLIMTNTALGNQDEVQALRQRAANLGLKLN